MSGKLIKSHMNSCTVQLWWNKQRIKKSGNVSLYIQLVSKRQSVQIPLKIEWPLDKIDPKKKEITKRMADDPDLLSFQSIIEREKAKYWNIIRRFLINNTDFKLTDVIREARLYQGGTMLIEFMENAIRSRQKAPKMKDRIKASTAEVHRASLNWVKKYLNDIDVPIQQVDGDWLEQFADYLRDSMGEPGVWVKIKDVKAYLGYAFSKRVQVNLDYKRYKVTLPEPDTIALDESQVATLLELYDNVERIGALRPYLRGFLFACLTGLRISDLQRWHKSWLRDGGFEFVPHKRRLSKIQPKPLFIPLIPMAQKFIRNLPDEKLGLPSDQEFNRGLKAIAAMAGINVKLTSHVARHTFGTSLAIKGVPIAVIAKLMGHKNLETTMRYINVAEQTKFKAMMQLQNYFETAEK
ncbi:site-specific integrase [Mucilaginibacter sp. Bleaf8]|uniref:site-specific integrase n=1 Tax=Mucilaginibacter sp. Bleaf8 TaxID=2834430 RepID=UPI001BCB8990|nr:site-specific integrase [Mucilaginibacter sp. Bleaf8]MBS7565169.1 site-specific integrase [Mucilaginibacter sp. Bleaf8]